MRTASLLLIVILVACDLDSDSAADKYTVTDSAGVRIVESQHPSWDNASVVIESDPLVQIGQEAEGPYLFSSVSFGLLLSHDDVAVVDNAAREVRTFDSTGRHLRSFGRGGEGPGEFGTIAALAEYRGDSLAVHDQRLRRTTLFSRSSGSHRTISLQLEGNYNMFGALRTGEFLFFSPGAGYRPDLAPGLQWVETDVVVVDPSDGSGRIVTRLPQREQLISEDGNTERMIPAHYSVRAVAPYGFYWATSDRYEIRFYSPDGELLRILRRFVEPEMVDQDMIEAYIAWNLEQVRQFEGEEAIPRYRARYEEAHRGDYVPLFQSAFVDGDQRLWISRSVWPSLDALPRSWSVFSEDGAWLGDLESPERLRLVDSRGDLVLGIWHDEFDAPYVQVHRIVHD